MHVFPSLFASVSLTCGSYVYDVKVSFGTDMKSMVCVENNYHSQVLLFSFSYHTILHFKRILSLCLIHSAILLYQMTNICVPILLFPQPPQKTTPQKTRNVIENTFKMEDAFLVCLPSYLMQCTYCSHNITPPYL